MIFIAAHHYIARSLFLIMVLTLLACTPESFDESVKTDHSNALSLTAASNPTPSNQTTRIRVVLSWEDLKTETLTAPDSGRLEQILVQAGQQVQAGQRLAQLQPKAQAGRQQIVTKHVDPIKQQQAYEKWKQDKRLYDQGFISKAAVAKSEAAYRLASQSQTQTKTINLPAQAAAPIWLQAPFNSVIEPLTALSGEEVKNGQKLFLIKPIDAKRIKILVSQDNAQPLFVGQRLNLRHHATDLTLQISELPPINDKQYVLAYAVWPQDLPKPQDLSVFEAHLLLDQTQTP